jgi:hypothetical protein
MKKVTMKKIHQIPKELQHGSMMKIPSKQLLPVAEVTLENYGNEPLTTNPVFATSTHFHEFSSLFSDSSKSMVKPPGPPFLPKNKKKKVTPRKHPN